METQQEVKVGMKVRTLCQYSEIGVIVRPRKSWGKPPAGDWHLVKFDRDDGHLYFTSSDLEVL